MNIREYTENIKRQYKGPPTNYNWRIAFDSAGFPSVLLGAEGHRRWPEVHQWCQHHIGKDHYTWTGSRFWFDNIDNAALFALRWS